MRKREESAQQRAWGGAGFALRWRLTKCSRANAETGLLVGDGGTGIVDAIVVQPKRT